MNQSRKETSGLKSENSHQLFSESGKTKNSHLESQPLYPLPNCLFLYLLLCKSLPRFPNQFLLFPRTNQILSVCKKNMVT